MLETVTNNGTRRNRGTTSHPKFPPIFLCSVIQRSGAGVCGTLNNTPDYRVLPEERVTVCVWGETI